MGRSPRLFLSAHIRVIRGRILFLAAAKVSSRIIFYCGIVAIIARVAHVVISLREMIPPALPAPFAIKPQEPRRGRPMPASINCCGSGATQRLFVDSGICPGTRGDHHAERDDYNERRSLPKQLLHVVLEALALF